MKFRNAGRFAFLVLAIELAVAIGGSGVALAQGGGPSAREPGIGSAEETRRESVTPGQKRRVRRLLSRLREALPEFSAVERRVLVREVRKLPEVKRKAIRKSVRKIESLSPAERSEFSARLRGLLANASKDVERMERNLGRWEGMSKRERETYREQMRKLRSMSDEERREVLGEWESRRARREEAPAR